jgi:hypothetical protein
MLKIHAANLGMPCPQITQNDRQTKRKTKIKTRNLLLSQPKLCQIKRKAQTWNATPQTVNTQ